MSLLDTLHVKLVADTSDFDAGLKRSQSAVSTFSALATGAMMGVGLAAVNAAGNAARAMVDMGGEAIAAASDLAESMNKTRVVMGSAAQAILDWSNSSATAFGMSRQAALDGATTFATFGKAAGLAGGDLEQFATGFVGLAADMASFYNTSPADAITAIGAALRGESEPIRRYGVLLDEATLRQQALALGIIATTRDALTPQQRVLAAEAAIWQQTSDAQGDFLRTSEGLANQQRIAAANWQNLSATIGTAFVPVMTQALLATNKFVSTALPYIGAVLNQVVVPAINSGLTVLTNWIGGLAGVDKAYDGSEQSVMDFTKRFVEGLNKQIDGINNIILGYQHWVNAAILTYNNILAATDQFVLKIANALNPIIDAFNAVNEAGNALNRATASVNPFNKTPVQVPSMQHITTGGASALSIDPIIVGQIDQISIAWDNAGNAATTAADKAGEAIATTATDAGKAIGGTIDDMTSKLKGALQQVPGLFGVSEVTQGDMDRAAAGLPNDYADTWRRRALDELVNGIDWAEIDPAEVATSLGLDPSVPANIIADELNRQWASGEFFANPENLAKINWAAVQAQLDRDAKAALGQKNILAAAMEAGITVESMAPLVGTMASTASEAISTSNFGDSIAQATVSAGSSTAAVTAYQTAGGNAFREWKTGWENAANDWYPPPPPPPPNSGNGGESGSGAGGAAGGTSSGTGGVPPASGTTGRSSVVNVTVNVAAGAGASGKAVGGAARTGVLNALRARGQV